MLLFLAFTCVMMINIFIAQLSNRFDDIQKNASREFDINKAKTIAKLELKDDFTCFYFGQVSRNSYKYISLTVNKICVLYSVAIVLLFLLTLPVNPRLLIFIC